MYLTGPHELLQGSYRIGEVRELTEAKGQRFSGLENGLPKTSDLLSLFQSGDVVPFEEGEERPTGLEVGQILWQSIAGNGEVPIEVKPETKYELVGKHVNGNGQVEHLAFVIFEKDMPPLPAYFPVPVRVSERL